MTYGSKSEEGFEAWLASSERTVLLPTGTWMKLVIPSARKLRLRGLFPNELLPTARSFENEGVKLSALDDDELGDFLRFMDYLIAAAVRSILIPDGESSDDRPSGEWRPVELTGADLAEAEIDEEDASALQAIVIRKLTPNQVTIAARRDRALARLPEMSEAERERHVAREIEHKRLRDRAEGEHAAEAADTVPGWSDFREERSGASRRKGGGEIREPAERDARDHRRDRGRGRR